jgi:hypothetical protein
MSDTIIQKASLVGQVIEDLTYEALSPPQFQVHLVGIEKSPQYKPGGFFVFSDLPSGNYTLRIVGKRFQPVAYPVAIPLADLVIDVPGENELFVIAKTVTDTGNGNGGTRVTVDQVILNKEIRVAAPVLASGFAATLAAALDVGRVMEVKLKNSDGELTPGSLVRIVRDKSIRLQFNPYYPLPFERTRLVGNIVRQDAPEITLESAQVRLTHVNSANVVLHDVAGAHIATVDIGETNRVLGAEKDTTTFTNHRGDYTLYFNAGEVLQNVTLEVMLTGYQSQTKTETISARERKNIDFQLTRA